MIGFLPDLEKNFLQHIIPFSLFMNDAVDRRSQSFAVPAIQLGKRVVTPVRNIFHQRLVGGC